MFPLAFPVRVIRAHQRIRGWIVDPFCGRGTTNLAARLAGKPTVGIDSSPIAVAIAKAKLCNTTIDRVVRVASRIVKESVDVRSYPQGDFWKLAYSPSTLADICRLRESLIENCSSDTRIVLRAIILGALHGPLTKRSVSHLSNQCPRTYAPKPDYSVRYWNRHRMKPPTIDVMEVVRVRAERFLRDKYAPVDNLIRLGDSRRTTNMKGISIGLVVTSPPYYGMRTYISDQWIRSWFLGGPGHVEYRPPTREIEHSSPEIFASDLRCVWRRLAERASTNAKMAIRFGGIHDRGVDHRELLKHSLRDSGWRLLTIVDAGDANIGKRQANQFLKNLRLPKSEHDFYAVVA